MTKGSAAPVDLLKDFTHVQTTLGFRIGLKSLDGRLVSCVVQQVNRFCSSARVEYPNIQIPQRNSKSLFHTNA